MESVLKDLRHRLEDTGLDGIVIPRGDAFSGEETPPSDARLAFISGFTGSAGLGVVMRDAAMLFSDGRYTLQMENQKTPGWDCRTMPDTKPEDWLLAHYRGAKIGFDPMLMTVNAFRQFERKLHDAGITLVPLDHNPVDLVWPDRPSPPATMAFTFDEAIAGQTRQQKIDALTAFLKDEKPRNEKPCPRHMLISDPAILCWLLNIRGRDLDYTPFVLAFAILGDDGIITVYADEERFADIAPTALRFRMPECLRDDLARCEGVIHLDPASCPVALFQAITTAVIEAENPALVMKARKTEAETAAFIAAHRTDAVAMIRFLHWFDRTIPTRPVRETEIDESLIRFRSAAPDFLCPSFPTICGGGANGAIVHYRAVAGQDQEIPMDSLCLIDSGGHYRQATTDITRTIATGTPPELMAQAFTRVLRAHIALATSRFPKGTNGVQLDAITRAPLWQAGLDFAHGTGHGVGCCLSVHEGPVSISKRSTRAIYPGMIISNEPGYYIAGEYGIRIENLVHVAASEAEAEDMLMLETISLVPIDRRLIRPGLMRDDEIAWINAYHRRIGDEIGPLVNSLGDDDLNAWLDAAIAPLG